MSTTTPATVPDALASDPVALGLMQGFPPPPERRVAFADGSAWAFPRTRWAFSHMRELFPTANVSRGHAPAVPLPQALRDDIDRVAFTALDGQPLTWAESLAANYADGIVVLHRGRLVYERYFGALQPELAHACMSVTKSFVGTLAAMQAHAGLLDPAAPVTGLLPEMRGTAYDGASVRQVMDMTIGVRYSEHYADPQADIWQFVRAGGLIPRPAGDAGPATLYDYLVRLQPEGRHGEAFAYKTVNTEVLAWIVQRVAGEPLAALLSRQLWAPLQPEHDAHLTVDAAGTAFGGGGLNTTLRDLARFGEMMRCGGLCNGRQVVPQAVVDEIRAGADREHFAKAGYATLPGWSYRHMWWIAHDAHGGYTARGVHGQTVWIDPTAEMVIARFGSHPVAANSPAIDRASLPAYGALARHLIAAS